MSLCVQEYGKWKNITTLHVRVYHIQSSGAAVHDMWYSFVRVGTFPIFWTNIIVANRDICVTIVPKLKKIIITHHLSFILFWIPRLHFFFKLPFSFVSTLVWMKINNNNNDDNNNNNNGPSTTTAGKCHAQTSYILKTRWRDEM